MPAPSSTSGRRPSTPAPCVTGRHRGSGGTHHEEETTQRGRLKHSAQDCHTLMDGADEKVVMIPGHHRFSNRGDRIGGSTTAWRILLCAPPLADASLDRRLQKADKSPRRDEALRTRSALTTPGACVSWRWARVRGTPRHARRDSP